MVRQYKGRVSSRHCTLNYKHTSCCTLKPTKSSNAWKCYMWVFPMFHCCKLKFKKMCIYIYIWAYSFWYCIFEIYLYTVCTAFWLYQFLLCIGLFFSPVILSYIQCLVLWHYSVNSDAVYILRVCIYENFFLKELRAVALQLKVSSGVLFAFCHSAPFQAAESILSWLSFSRHHSCC